MFRAIITLLIMTSIYSCIEINHQFSKLPPGIWRGTLELDNTPYAGDQEVSYDLAQDDIIPFLFELKYDESGDFYIEIMNGDEKIKVYDISYGRDKATAKDTVIIDFPVFDSYIRGIYEENIIEGVWHVNYRGDYNIPFKAYYGQNHLFSTDKEAPEVDITGRWETTFEIGTPDEYPAIGEFKQNGNHLEGTFLTETGDYRYLVGEVIKDKFYLTTFDGAHAFLFKGKVLDNGEITGIFRSGKHYTTNWSANRNEEATLSNAYELTQVKNAKVPISFSFPDLQGNMVNLEDDSFTDKIKVIQLMGTWCPNCKDESKFLKEFAATKQAENVEIIAISYERYEEKEKALASISRFVQKMEIPYHVLYGGYYDKSIASETFPMLNKIMSYPTLIYLDKNNIARKIYTGFYGPATKQYTTFKEDFYQTITELKNEL